MQKGDKLPHIMRCHSILIINTNPAHLSTQAHHHSTHTKHTHKNIVIYWNQCHPSFYCRSFLCLAGLARVLVWVSGAHAPVWATILSVFQPNRTGTGCAYANGRPTQTQTTCDMRQLQRRRWRWWHRCKFAHGSLFSNGNNISGLPDVSHKFYYRMNLILIERLGAGSWPLTRLTVCCCHRCCWCTEPYTVQCVRDNTHTHTYSLRITLPPKTDNAPPPPSLRLQQYDGSHKQTQRMSKRHLHLTSSHVGIASVHFSVSNSIHDWLVELWGI